MAVDSHSDAFTNANGLQIADSWVVAGSQPTSASTTQFLQVTNLLLERVQLNSTHLFRADILHDSAGELQTLAEKESESDAEEQPEDVEPWTAPSIHQFELQRTVIRRLIPRKPQLDNPLEQSCFIYRHNTSHDRLLVIYVPHCESSAEMPWYHPKVKALAYLFTTLPDSSTLSVQYLSFPQETEPSTRLERTFLSLLNTIVRLLKHPPTQQTPSQDSHPPDHNILTMPLTAAALRDTILPQHTVQNTYTRLKQIYASDLISRWIEKTEPSKHVFEDLSIAAFLIELWKTMYDTQSDDTSKFPGFVDLACGNGVLVYVLVNQGFRGYGFDARRRKTWDLLDIATHVEERVCIPRPFLASLKQNDHPIDDLAITSGRFPPGTFMISNHADELTCWTPLLAALSCPEQPLPFLAIPCCSHALDGSRHRFTSKEVEKSTFTSVLEEQPLNGDLKALRNTKDKEIARLDDKAMYTCLTRKTAALAQELGITTEMTLMRIPSTRNIGIVGNGKLQSSTYEHIPQVTAKDVIGKINEIVDRECRATGGLDVSAQTWLERAQRLQTGQGRGKVNLKMKT